MKPPKFQIYAPKMSFQEGIEYLNISHKNIEAEKKKMESVLEKERKSMENKSSSNLMTAQHRLTLASTLSGICLFYFANNNEYFFNKSRIYFIINQDWQN